MAETQVATMHADVAAALPSVPMDRDAILERVIGIGDLSGLTEGERVSYIMKLCSSLGLNPFTRPIELMKLNGKTVAYAKRDAADQLRKIHNVSLEITSRTVVGDLIVVTTKATLPSGRCDEDLGAVSIKGLQGEAAANALLKAITKSKRRVTLSICGLGFLDESEVESIRVAEAEQTQNNRQAIAQTIAETRQAPRTTAVIELTTPGTDGTVAFPRTKAGAIEAIKYLKANPHLVVLNLQLLDSLVAKLPDLSDAIADVRAEAARALTPAGDIDADGWPGHDAGAEQPQAVA